MSVASMSLLGIFSGTSWVQGYLSRGLRPRKKCEPFVYPSTSCFCRSFTVHYSVSLCFINANRSGMVYHKPASPSSETNGLVSPALKRQQGYLSQGLDAEMDPQGKVASI